MPAPWTVCILSQDGEIVVHRNMKARPDTLLTAIAPYRDDLVMAVKCVFTWYWLADLCAREGIPFVLGHALSMKAIHGGKAKYDKIDAHKMAVLLRGGMLPQAYVYPAPMRATRDLLRRRSAPALCGKPKTRGGRARRASAQGSRGRWWPMCRSWAC
jgi:hypothetical protein